MKSIDLKSLTIGFLACAVVFLLMGQAIQQSRYDIECVTNEYKNEGTVVACRQFDRKKPFTLPNQEARIFSFGDFRKPFVDN